MGRVSALAWSTALESRTRAARSNSNLDRTGAGRRPGVRRYAKSLGESIMGFWNGRVTFTRYRVGGELPVPFGEEVLEQARGTLIGRHSSARPGRRRHHRLGRRRTRARPDPRSGQEHRRRCPASGHPHRHRQDSGCAFACLHPDRDRCRRPVEPSGIATKAQRQEAKEAAKQRAEAEAADGRFRRLNHFPVLWDGRTNTLYAGSTSTNVLDRLASPVPRDVRPGARAAHGRQPGRQPATDARRRPLGDPERRTARAGQRTGWTGLSVAWADDDPTGLDYLGNEFLVWIWHALQNDGETVKLADGSEVTVMLAKTLTLDCPRGETGPRPTHRRLSRSGCPRPSGRFRRASCRARPAWSSSAKVSSTS